MVNSQIQVSPSYFQALLMSPAAERYSAVTCPNRLSGMGFIMICLKPGGGRIGCDAGNGFPNPFTYASIGIMIEAVHAARSHSFVYHIAVPPFPDGGGSIVHRVQPAWVLTLEEEFIGNVFHAILREGGHENGCAQESGLQAKDRAVRSFRAGGLSSSLWLRLPQAGSLGQIRQEFAWC